MDRIKKGMIEKVRWGASCSEEDDDDVAFEENADDYVEVR
jgi:hypothetical protein